MVILAGDVGHAAVTIPKPLGFLKRLHPLVVKQELGAFYNKRELATFHPQPATVCLFRQRSSLVRRVLLQGLAKLPGWRVVVERPEGLIAEKKDGSSCTFAEGYPNALTNEEAYKTTCWVGIRIVEKRRTPGEKKRGSSLSKRHRLGFNILAGRSEGKVIR